MESTHEQWPLCPEHRHELHARAAGDHIEWQCSDTGRAFARFGELPEVGLA
jgi:hypothetical protein